MKKKDNVYYFCIFWGPLSVRGLWNCLKCPPLYGTPVEIVLGPIAQTFSVYPDVTQMDTNAQSKTTSDLFIIAKLSQVTHLLTLTFSSD